LYKINKALAFDTIPQLDWCCLCKCICTVDAEISYLVTKKNYRRCLYMLSLGEEMVTQHIRRRADSGNIERHTRRVMRAMGVTCKQPASSTTVKQGGGRRNGRWSIHPTAKGRKRAWKCCQCSEWVCQDHSIKTIQITCDNCTEQSYYRQISFTFMF